MSANDGQAAITRPISVGSATATLAARLATLPATSSAHGSIPPRRQVRESASSGARGHDHPIDRERCERGDPAGLPMPRHQRVHVHRVQSDQLDAQHDQLESLRKVNEKQIEVLGLQAADLRESLDERKRETEELRSAQAARVFISQMNGTRFKSTELNMSELLDSDTPTEFPASDPECFRATLTVVNTSDRPIYDAELRWRRGSANHGGPNPESLGTIMPGGKTERTREFPLDTNMAVSGAILRFRDAAGVRWIRRSDGGLVEQR